MNLPKHVILINTSFLTYITLLNRNNQPLTQISNPFTLYPYQNNSNFHDYSSHTVIKFELHKILPFTLILRQVTTFIHPLGVKGAYVQCIMVDDAIYIISRRGERGVFENNLHQGIRKLILMATGKIIRRKLQVVRNDC